MAAWDGLRTIRDSHSNNPTERKGGAACSLVLGKQHVGVAKAPNHFLDRRAIVLIGQPDVMGAAV
jgi:hypothetical protein